MKRLLCTFLLICGSIYAQDSSIKKEKKGYRTHSIAISQRFGGTAGLNTIIDPSIALSQNENASLKNLGQTRYDHYATFLTSIEFFTQKRTGRTQYTPMVAVRLGYADSNIGSSWGGFHWGFLFGGSQYVFDARAKTTGLGWSMLVNGGLTLDFPTIDKMEKINFPIILGGEIDFKTIYNFHKNVGITFGVNFGYNFSAGILNPAEVSLSSTENLTGPGVPPLGLLFDHNFSWAFNVGFIF